MVVVDAAPRLEHADAEPKRRHQRRADGARRPCDDAVVEQTLVLLLQAREACLVRSVQPVVGQVNEDAQAVLHRAHELGGDDWLRAEGGEQHERGKRAMGVVNHQLTPGRTLGVLSKVRQSFHAIFWRGEARWSRRHRRTGVAFPQALQSATDLDCLVCREALCRFELERLEVDLEGCNVALSAGGGFKCGAVRGS